MRYAMIPVAAVAAGLALAGALKQSTGSAQNASPAAAPRAALQQPVAYTPDGRLLFPAGYREWIFLSSGLDMSYRQDAQPGHSMFDNVFVDARAYRAFQETGTWPDLTALVTEVRGAATKGSINVSGRFQTPERMGIEVHVKDTRRFAGGWGFFAFASDAPAQLIPASAECYTCHAQHAAVDTTFVQFYPTLLPVAQAHGTVKPGT
jgi:hypothetical protein